MKEIISKINWGLQSNLSIGIIDSEFDYLDSIKDVIELENYRYENKMSIKDFYTIKTFIETLEQLSDKVVLINLDLLTKEFIPFIGTYIDYGNKVILISENKFPRELEIRTYLINQKL